MNHDTRSAALGWAVVGGGALGLTLATRLAQQGVPVTLLEAAPSLGGLASPWKLGEGDAAVEWDRYYHVTLLSDLHLRGVLRELGLEADMQWVETKTGFFTDGKLYSMSNSLEFLQFPPLTLIEKIRLGLTIYYASKIKDWRKLERVSVADWLVKHSGRGVFEKIWLPLLRAKLGEPYKQTSAAFIWAHINRMYSARRSGLKKEMFGYVRGGYATVIDRWSKHLAKLGVQICTGSAVERVERRDSCLEVQLAGGEQMHFSNVVFTTPTHTIAAACPGLSADDRTRLEAVKYLGIVCASLLLKKPISPYYVTNITDTWVPLTAVIEMTNIVDRSELAGHALVYLPKYVPADDELFSVSDDVLRERWISTLEQMYPEFSRHDVAAFRISRTKHVMALPTIDYSQRLPPMQLSVPGVWGVNSAHILKGNLNVNETIQIAEQAIAGVLAPAIDKTLRSKLSHEPHIAHAAPDCELVARS